MEEFNIQGKQTSFYKYCPVTFGYTLVYDSQENDSFKKEFSFLDCFLPIIVESKTQASDRLL